MVQTDPVIEGIFGETIYTYTSKQAEDDGFLFDVDKLLSQKRPLVGALEKFPIKYITTALLDEGYWNDRCKKAVLISQAGINDCCKSCITWMDFIQSGGELSCKTKTLNVASVLDLINQALIIWRKKPQDETFVSGDIELPNGKQQKVFLAQNETYRYTLMLPSDY